MMATLRVVTMEVLLVLMLVAEMVYSRVAQMVLMSVGLLVD